MENWSAGIDIGSENIKMVCLSKSHGGYRLMAHALIPRSDSKALQAIFEQREIRKADLRVSIQDPKIKIKKLLVPKVPPEEQNEIVKWALKDAAKIQVENFIVRNYPLGAPTEKEQQFMALAIEKTSLDSRLSEIKKLGLGYPKVVEPHIQALANSVIHNYGLSATDRYAVVDFGRTAPQFLVVCAEGLLYYRPFSSQISESLKAQVSMTLGLVMDDADKYITGTASEITADQKEKLENIFNYFCSKLSTEIQYSTENYLAQFPGQPPTKLLLAGGGAALQGLQTHVQEALKVPTELFETFQRVDAAQFDNADIENVKLYYGVATGLAL